MKHWPKSVYFSFAILTFTYGLFSIWLYRQTVASHYAVGSNNGRIEQATETMGIIRNSVPVAKCNDLQNDKHPTEFLNAKAERIDMVIAEDGSVQFCGY